jgi:hypothetical protein
VVDHLQQKWQECYQENQKNQVEIERLQEELAEAQRRHKIALDNAYAEGYEHAQADARRDRRNRG